MTIGAFQGNKSNQKIHLPADAPQRGDGAVAHLHVLLAMRLKTYCIILLYSNSERSTLRKYMSKENKNEEK